MFPIELSFLIQNRAIFRTLNCRKKKVSFDRKKSFHLKVLIPCTVTKLFENRPKNNKTAVRRF